MSKVDVALTVFVVVPLAQYVGGWWGDFFREQAANIRDWWQSRREG